MAHITSQKVRGVVVCAIQETKLLDEMMIREVGAELVEMMNRAEKQMLLVNFGQVRYMSSAMLGRLVSLHKECGKNKIGLKLSNIRDDLQEIFKVTGLDKLLKIYKDEADAMAAFEKEGWLI